MCGPTKLANDNDANRDDGKRKKGTLRQRVCSWLRCLSRIVLFVMGAAFTLFVCYLSSERYLKYWVQTTIERTDVHVSEIAFPAIHICPNSISIEFFADKMPDPEEQELNRLNKLFNRVHSSLWLEPIGEPITQMDFQELEDLYNYPLDTILKYLTFAHKCEDLFMQCTWRRRVVNCCTLFKKLDNGGNCYAFNSMFAADADPTWPWSVAGSGFRSGLNVRMHRFVGDMRVESVGVVVSEPGQCLGTTVAYSTDDRVVVPLEPLRFTAESGVRARPVQMRRCYFKDEMKQSRSECINTCHIKYITARCKCHFELPIPKKRDAFNATKSRKCTVKDLPCFQEHRLSLFTMSNIIEESIDNVFNTTDCKCYPECNNIQYHTSIFTDRHGIMEKNDSYIEVDAFFQEETLFSYRSTLHITAIDLIVSYGGIAGLIMGISVIGCINSCLDRFLWCTKPRHKEA